MGKVGLFITTAALMGSAACVRPVDTFYLTDKAYSTTCEKIRKEGEYPYNPTSVCPAYKSKYETIRISSFIAQQSDKVKELIKEALECTFQPLPVEFVFDVPDEPYNIMYIGGLGKLMAQSGKRKTYEIGMGDYDKGNLNHTDELFVVVSNAEGEPYSLEDIVKALIHEVAHNLGLDHPNKSNKDPDFMTQKRIARWYFNHQNARLLIKNTLGELPSIEFFEKVEYFTNTDNICGRVYKKLKLSS